jgi:hypothetical protein
MSSKQMKLLKLEMQEALVNMDHVMLAVGYPDDLRQRLAVLQSSLNYMAGMITILEAGE